MVVVELPAFRHQGHRLWGWVSLDEIACAFGPSRLLWFSARTMQAGRLQLAQHDSGSFWLCYYNAYCLADNVMFTQFSYTKPGFRETTL